jgi:hypothetical protein
LNVHTKKSNDWKSLIVSTDVRFTAHPYSA